ncbi:MAG: hypothetical protein QXK47_02465 [Candidatus Bathyarchaeia archaeon]
MANQTQTRRNCKNCKHCKNYSGYTQGFWCDYLNGLVPWETVKAKLMCGGEGYEAVS